MDVKSIRFAFLIGFSLSSLLSLIAFRTVIFPPGLVEWGDLTFHYQISTLRSYYSSTWNPYVSVDNGWSMPFFPANFLSVLVDSTEVFQRLTFFLTLTLTGLIIFVTFFAWSRERYKNIASCYVGSFAALLIYSLNPWVTNRVGHYAYLWGYAFVPLLFYFTVKAIDQSFWKETVKYALLASLALFLTTAAYTIFFLISFFVAYLIIFEVLFRIKENGFVRSGVYLRNGLVLLSIVIGVTSLLFAYYLLPYVFVFASEYTTGPFWRTVTIDTLNWLSSQSSIFNVARLSGYWWTEGLFGANGMFKLVWIFSTLLAPILGFLAILLRPKDKTVQSLSIVAVVTIFLGKGVQEPAGNFYSWLVLYGPFSSISLRIGIHDPDRWAALLAFSYAFLSAITVMEILNKMRRKFVHPKLVETREYITERLGIFKRLSRISITTILLTVILLCFASVSAFPLLSGDLRGHITPVLTPSPYQDLNQWLASQEGEYRAYWLPQWVQFKWMNRGIDPQASVWLSSKPVLYYGSPQVSEYVDFIYNVLINDNTRNIGKLIGLFSTKYVIYHNDTVENYGPLYETLLKQDDLKKVYEKDFLSVFSSEYASPYVFSLKNVMYLLGDLNSLLFLTSIKSLAPNEWAILFLDQVDESNLASLSNSADSSVLVFFGEYAAEPLLSDNLQKTSHLLNDSKTRIMYVANSTYSSESLNIFLRRSSRYIIGLRNNGLPDFDELTVILDNQTVAPNLASSTRDSEWIYVGPIELDSELHELDFSRIQGETSIVSVWPMGWFFKVVKGGTAWRLLTPEEVSNVTDLKVPYDEQPKKIQDFIKTYLAKPETVWGKVILIPDVVLYSLYDDEEMPTLDTIFGEPTTQPVLSYQKLGPSEVSVKVNASQPFVLAFSEAYHEFWEAHTGDIACDKVQLFSLTNGFLINRTGEFEIKLEFRAEKYFRLGSVVSFLTLSLVVLVCLVLDQTFRNAAKRFLSSVKFST